MQKKLTFRPIAPHCAARQIKTDAKVTKAELIIFDCDGVLVDSEDLSADVLIAETGKLGIRLDRTYVREHFIGRSFPTVARLLKDTFACALPDDFEMIYRKELLQRFETELQPTVGIADLLSRLSIPKCVATSSSPQRTAKALAISGLAAYFGPHVFTASQVERGKPFPDLFIFSAKQMGVDPKATVVVEDSLPGIQAALAAGMIVFAYCGGAHMGGRPYNGPSGVTVFDNWADFPHLLRDLN